MKCILLMCLILVSIYILSSCDKLTDPQPPQKDWIRSDSLNSNINSIDLLNSNFGFAVGNATYYFDGTHWLPENDNSGTDIEVISPTCVYTDDSYFNGVSWTSTGYNGDCVTGLDPNHIWVGGYSGKIRFYNGTIWTDLDLDYGSIVSIDAQQSNVVYAIDYYGKIIKYNGIGWRQVYQISEAPSGNQDYFVTDIKVISNGDFWVTLQANYMSKGLVYHFTNDNFASKWITDAGVNCVDALSSDDVWFGGYAASIWHYDGSSNLKKQTVASIQSINDIIIGEDYKYAVGSNGVILKKR